MQDVLEEGRTQSVFPSASLWVADNLHPLFDVHVGEANPDSLWDLASLTKPMSVVSLVMELHAQGVISLDERPARCKATVRQLLGHRSGLPAWWDLSQLLQKGLADWKVGSDATREFVRAAIEEAVPGGTHAACYSDLGYMLLGWHLEERTGKSLDSLMDGYGVGEQDLSRVMPGGWCPFRERHLRGEVNDLNTFLLGGVAGHAGLFGTAHQVGMWALELVRAYHGQSGRFAPDVVRSYWQKTHFEDTDTWVLGFDTPTPGKSSAGNRIGIGAVGHLGFTGTSVWIDPQPGRVAVLLTNRVAGPPEAQATIKRFRPRLHDVLFEALDRL